MQKIRLHVVGMSYSQSQSGAYALILKEVDGKRRLPIIIGGFEAQAIAIELEKMKPSRPLTHDLFKSFAQAYDVLLTEVVICKFHEGVFYARLVCTQGDKETEIDARTSDAVALALRFDCPIFTYSTIMDAASITEEDETSDEISLTEEFMEASNSLEGFSLPELQEMLDKAVVNEDYELASEIRDEMNRRKGMEND